MDFQGRIPTPSITRSVWWGAWGVRPWTRRSPPCSVQCQQHPSQRMRLDIGPHVWQDWFQSYWRWCIPQACKGSFGISNEQGCYGGISEKPLWRGCWSLKNILFVLVRTYWQIRGIWPFGLRTVTGAAPAKHTMCIKMFYKWSSENRFFSTKVPLAWK